MRTSKWLGVLLVLGSVSLCLSGDGWHVGLMAVSALLAFFGLSLLVGPLARPVTPPRRMRFKTSASTPAKRRMRAA